MFVRACYLPFLSIFLIVGCQTPVTRLFPWTDDSSVASLTEAELNHLRDEVFADTGQRTADESEPRKGSATDNQQQDRLDRIDAWLRRGQNAILQAGDTGQSAPMLSEATHSFREALRIDPENTQAFHGLAIVSDLNQDWESADYSYKRALAIRPDDVNLLNDQGYSYLLQNRYHEASQYLNRALQISPGHEKAHINLAILDIRQGNEDSALVRLGQVYPAAKARLALASLTDQHRPTASPTEFGSPMTPGQHERPLIAGPGGPRHLLPPGRTPHYPADQSSGSHAWQTQMTQPKLFNPNGVIETQQVQRGGVQPVSAAGYQTHANRVSPANMQQPVGTTSVHRAPFAGSPLDSARTVGGTLQIPHQQNLSRPQLPPSANVYNPGYTSSRDLIQQATAQHRSAQVPAEIPAIDAGPNGSYPAQQPPMQFQRGRHIHNGPNTGVPGPASHFQSSGGLQNQAYPAPQIQSPRAPQHQTGPFYGNPATSTGGQVQRFPQQHATQQQYAGPQAGNRTHGGVSHPQELMPHAPATTVSQYPEVTNPVAWPQSVPSGGTQSAIDGQHRYGAYGMQQPSAAGPPLNTPGQPGPGYFSPPPVMGHGYRDQSVAAPDPLAEYRSTRQQLENEYNQTLQKIGQPLGGRSFQ
ncbi:MAG: tetratricopeptide repeat protein [Planctomycetaceae bacterium]